MKRAFLLNLFLILALSLANASIDSLKQELLSLREQGDQKKLQEIHLQLGNTYHNLYQHQEALDHYMISLDFAEKLADSKAIYELLNLTGKAYFWLDNYQAALENYLKAREIGAKFVTAEEQIDNLSQTAEVYISLGNYKQAHFLELEALDVAVKSGNEEGMANAHRVIGTIFWYREKFDEALEHLSQALDIYRNLPGNEIYEYTIYASMASVYTQKKQPRRALEYIQKSLTIAQEIPYEYGVVFSEGMLGTIKKDLGELEEAGKLVSQAIRQFGEMNIMAEAADFQIVLADIYTQQKQYSKAVALLDSTLVIAGKIQSLQLECQALKGLADNYDAMGKISLALDYFKQYASRRDSLINEKDARQMALMDTEFILKRKQEEILQLEKQNKQMEDRLYFYILIGGIFFMTIVVWLFYIRYKSQEKAARLLEEKNHEISNKNLKLARANEELLNMTDIISTDVISPLHHIYEQAKNLETDTENKEAVKSVARNIQSETANIESLLTGLKTQTLSKDNKSETEILNLGEIIGQATAGLPESLKKYPAKIRFSTLPTIKANRRQMVRLFQTLISNSIRFRQGDDPVIYITFEEKDEFIILNYSDNSKGLPQTDQEESLCHTVLGNLQGAFLAQSVFGEGNVFIMKIPA